MARPGLDKHPKYRMLLRMLGEARPHVRGYLETLWEVAYECGDPIIGSAEAIEAAAEYPGEPGKLFNALLKCGGDKAGFIEETPGRPGCYSIHDLNDHAPEYVKKRFQRESERKNSADNGRQRQTTDDNGAPTGTRRPAPAPTPAPIKTGSGVFANVHAGTLKDPMKLDDWWRKAYSQPKPVISGSEQDRLRVHGAAVRAIDPKVKSKNATAVFVSLVSGRLWENITAEQEDRAQMRIKELDRFARGDPPNADA